MSRDRKKQHIDLALQQRASGPFDRVRLRHEALPEVSLEHIDLATDVFDQTIGAPIFISSMTGGIEAANHINRNLAVACRHHQIPMGVGSQRISMTHGHQQGFQSIREVFGSGILMANFGAVNLPNLAQVRDLDAIVDPLQADALILHLNSMQEVYQTAGDTDWRRVVDRIQEVIDWSPIPVIIKEVGFGMAPQTVDRLFRMGAAAVDVAGSGGTRFDQIEAAMNPSIQAQSERFSDWGFNTLECLQAIEPNCPNLWASGGLRHGLDAAKALALGASLCGFAGAVLPAAIQSESAVINLIDNIRSDLALACFGVGVDRSTRLSHEHIWSIQ